MDQEIIDLLCKLLMEAQTYIVDDGRPIPEKSKKYPIWQGKVDALLKAYCYK